MPETVGVAEAQRRFSELVDRVERGERFIVLRRGRPVLGLVPPDEVGESSDNAPAGLLSIVGALPELAEAVADAHASRRSVRDRPAPDLG